MIYLILQHSEKIAAILLSLAAVADAIGDWLKFHTTYKKADFIWHVVKYGIVKPFIYIGGILSADAILSYLMLLYTHFDYYVWHYTDEFVTVVIWGILFPIIMWNVIYRYLKNKK